MRFLIKLFLFPITLALTILVAACRLLCQLSSMVLGIVGALVGGFLGGALLGVSYNSIFSFQGLITSIIGALIVLAVWGFVAKRRS